MEVLKSKKSRVKRIVFSSILVCFFMYLVEVYMQPSYMIKSVIKLLLFGGIVLLSMLQDCKEMIIKQLKFKVREAKISIILGILTFAIILLAYHFFSELIDGENIRQNLFQKEKVTAQNYLFIAIYIAIFNSFLEELLFRGYVFYGIYSLGYRKLSYFFSSGLFALYHIAIISDWFILPVFILIITCLFVVGIIFDKLTEKYKSFKASWLIHVTANISINFIGFLLINGA